MLLFSMGSNCPEQLANRLGRPLYGAHAAYLPKHRRVYRGWSTKWRGGTATCIPDKRKNVFGYVTEVSEADLDRLDIFEGALMTPPKTKRKKVMVKVVSDRETPVNRQAILYLSTSDEFNRPSTEYLEQVVKTVAPFWNNVNGGAVTIDSFEIS